MKRCPTCDKTFPDGMKFCQTDGTVLVADAPDSDPYKTVVGNQGSIPAPPLDPFKTMVASAPKADDEDLLQLPEESDSMKTMVVSQEEIKNELKSGEADDAPLDLPPAPSAPLVEPQFSSSSSNAPKSNEPSLSPPSFSNFGQSSAGSSDAADSGVSQQSAPPNFDSKPFQNDFSGQSPYGNTDNLPIPSPFQDSMPPGGYQPPPVSPFNEPKTPVKEYEPTYREPQESTNQSPFGQSPSNPFGQSEPLNQQFGQAEWTPPPAPVAGWQDQGLGANTPFQPPVTGQGENQTLAIVSLVLGIVGIVLCQLTAPAALITGFMARRKAEQNPNEYGGSGLALAGIITGGIGTLLLVLVAIYFLVVFAALFAR